MGPETFAIQGRIDLCEHFIIGKGTQEIVVTGMRLMRARENHVDDTQTRCGADALIGHPASRTNVVTGADGVFERADHGRADGDDSPAARSRPIDRNRRRKRNAVRLIERQTRIERSIARRRDARGMSDRCELDATLPQRSQESPLEHEAGGRGLVRDR